MEPPTAVKNVFTSSFLFAHFVLNTLFAVSVVRAHHFSPISQTDENYTQRYDGTMYVHVLLHRRDKMAEAEWTNQPTRKREKEKKKQQRKWSIGNEHNCHKTTPRMNFGHSGCLARRQQQQQQLWRIPASVGQRRWIHSLPTKVHYSLPCDACVCVCASPIFILSRCRSLCFFAIRFVSSESDGPSDGRWVGRLVVWYSVSFEVFG